MFKIYFRFGLEKTSNWLNWSKIVLISIRAKTVAKVWSLPRFWISISSYKKQPIKKKGGRILDLAWLKFAVAALGINLTKIAHNVLDLLTLVLKIIYSEKVTKFCEIFTLLLSYVVPVKSKAKISQNFVGFSELMEL